MPLLNNRRRLYAVMYPIGRWNEPCEVWCECGYRQQVPTCTEGQRVAWAHDADHWAGTVGVFAQGALLFDEVTHV